MEGIRRQDFDLSSVDLLSASPPPPANVELLLGPYRCGKTTQLIEELLNFKASDPLARVLLLVPSARYGRILKQRINQALKKRSPKIGPPKIGPPGSTGSVVHPGTAGVAGEAGAPRILPGLFGLEIQPFYHACLSVIRSQRGEPRIIPEEIRPTVVATLLNELKSEGKLRSLLKIAGFHGTAASLLELIDELQRAGFSPVELIARLEESSCHESHLLELASVYSRYILKLKELGYHDQKSLALAAREELYSSTSHSTQAIPLSSQRSKIDQDSYQMILIDGFDRISHLQAQVFAGLAHRTPITRITFDYLSGELEHRAIVLQQISSDYRWKDSSYGELISNLQPKILPFGNMRSKFHPSDFHPPEIQAKSVLDPYLEMVEVAREVKSALQIRRVPSSEIVVVLRSPDAYNGAIEAAFEDAGIPYFIDGSSKVHELVPLRFILSLLNLQENDFCRKDFVDLLRSPYLNLEVLSMDARDVSNVDRESYNAKLIGGKSSWLNFLSKSDFDKVRPGLMKLMLAVSYDESAHSAEVHARRIEDIVEKYMILPGSEHDLRSAAAVQERESIKALRRALRVLISEEKTLELEAVSFHQFWNRFAQLIEKANFARPHPDGNAVTICSAELVPNNRFREIFICGLVEGEFPRHQRAKGFLSPDELHLWLSFGIDIRNPRHEAGFERALFYSLTERCSGRLHLSLSQFSAKGEETIPSFYLSELMDSSSLKLNRLRPFQEAAFKPVSVRDALSLALWDSDPSASERLSLQHDAIAYRWQNLSTAISATLNRGGSARPENLYNGYLADLFETGALSLPKQDKWTASKFNDYGKCPFRFWASHVLSLKPREEAEPGLNNLVVGIFYHKVLELFFAQWKDLRGAEARGAEVHDSVQDADAENELALNLLDKVFAEGIIWLEKRADFQAGPYWAQEKKNLKFRLRRFLIKELRRLDTQYSLYQPSLFEADFGGSSPDAFPPLVIKGDDGNEIIISGTIDRVDLESSPSFDSSRSRGLNRARVIDYKSGGTRISSKDAELGRNIQLPIYALALERCIMPGRVVSEADYLSISAAESVGHLNFENEKHSGLKDLAESLVREFASSAKNGVFTVKPKGQIACKNCNHATVCRVKELRLQLEEDSDAATD